jgi:hypothetical protein
MAERPMGFPFRGDEHPAPTGPKAMTVRAAYAMTPGTSMATRDTEVRTTRDSRPLALDTHANGLGNVSVRRSDSPMPRGIGQPCNDSQRQRV